MKAINPIKTGVALGAVLALIHASWALMVAAGVAQRLVDLVFWLHFIQPLYIILPFDITTAVMLVAMTAICGFVVGCVFGFFWNRLHLS